MQKAVKKDIPQILEYIERELPCCLYMYADITVYGIDGPNIDVWFDRDAKGVCRVVMRYHNSFQVYSDRDFSVIDPILRLVEEYRPDGISGRKELIEKLAPVLESNYNAVYGAVFKGRGIDEKKYERRLEECPIHIVEATEDDAEDIAGLICMDEDLRSVYTRDSLASELRERIRTGMGRSYIIRKNGQVVAHNATYAETDRFVIASGFIVHPDHRDSEYAAYVEQRSMLEFTRGGKDYYFFDNNTRLIRSHKFVGNQIVAEYGKLSRRDIRRG